MNGFNIGDKVVVTRVDSGLHEGESGYYGRIGDTGTIVEPPRSGVAKDIPYVVFDKWTGRFDQWQRSGSHNHNGKPAFWWMASCLELDDTLFS